jgi:hypothetical protein
MNVASYDLITPCKNCPFRSDIKPFITAARAKEILQSQGEFNCHKTIEVGEPIDDDEETWCAVKDDSNAQVCAGFLILLENDGSPNQMMRIAERLRLYDPGKLRMDAPVYKSVRAAISAHRKAPS